MIFIEFIVLYSWFPSNSLFLVVEYILSTLKGKSISEEWIDEANVRTSGTMWSWQAHELSETSLLFPSWLSVFSIYIWAFYVSAYLVQVLNRILTRKRCDLRSTGSKSTALCIFSEGQSANVVIRSCCWLMVAQLHCSGLPSKMEGLETSIDIFGHHCCMLIIIVVLS